MNIFEKHIHNSQPYFSPEPRSCFKTTSQAHQTVCLPQALLQCLMPVIPPNSGILNMKISHHQLLSKCERYQWNGIMVYWGSVETIMSLELAKVAVWSRWGDWQGHVSTHPWTGLTFHDIRFKGDRIAYELSLNDQVSSRLLTPRAWTRHSRSPCGSLRKQSTCSTTLHC